jgi:osmotically-inducible protein OsmY
VLFLARAFHIRVAMNHSTNSRSLFSWILIVMVVLPLTFSACGKTVGETIDDATITARVKTALLNDPQVGGMRIDVDTTQGVVTMSGTVKTQAEAARAVQLARQAPGVKDVKSTLQVNP